MLSFLFLEKESTIRLLLKLCGDYMKLRILHKCFTQIVYLSSNVLLNSSMNCLPSITCLFQKSNCDHLCLCVYCKWLQCPLKSCVLVLHCLWLPHEQRRLWRNSCSSFLPRCILGNPYWLPVLHSILSICLFSASFLMSSWLGFENSHIHYKNPVQRQDGSRPSSEVL